MWPFDAAVDEPAVGVVRAGQGVFHRVFVEDGHMVGLAERVDHALPIALDSALVLKHGGAPIKGITGQIAPLFAHGLGQCLAGCGVNIHKNETFPDVQRKLA